MLQSARGIPPGLKQAKDGTLCWEVVCKTGRQRQPAGWVLCSKGCACRGRRPQLLSAGSKWELSR